MVSGSARAKFLGGGTNLVDLMREGIETPVVRVVVTRLPLAEITQQPDGALRIGATVRNTDLAAHAVVGGGGPGRARAGRRGGGGARGPASTAWQCTPPTSRSPWP